MVATALLAACLVPTLEPGITIAAIGAEFRVAWIDDRDGVNALYATTCVAP